MARSANREGVRFLETALALLAELPETPATLSDAFAIRITLGIALIALQSMSTPSTRLQKMAHDMTLRPARTW